MTNGTGANPNWLEEFHRARSGEMEKRLKLEQDCCRRRPSDSLLVLAARFSFVRLRFLGRDLCSFSFWVPMDNIFE